MPEEHGSALIVYVTMPDTESGGSTQFLRQLQEECAHYAEHYGFKREELGRGFEAWTAHLLAQESGFNEILDGNASSEVDLNERILRHNDLGIDVVLEDQEDKQLMLAQSKWVSKRPPNLTETIESFFGIHYRLLNPDFIASGGTRIRELLSDYGDKVRDGYTIRLRFVVNRTLQANDRRSAAIQSIQNQYALGQHRVICELFDQTALKELRHQLSSSDTGILETIEFSVQSNDAVEFESPRHGMICRILGNELRNLYNRHKQSLFTFNIRQPMGLQRAINKEIASTAAGESDNFFFYNNGVSAVCANFKYDKKLNLVTADRFQIINGAQTVGAIAGAPNSSDLSVLFRLTETNETTGGIFTDNIIRFNNLQNPVEVADFRANDPIQQFLVQELDKFSGKGPVPNFVYVPKRGGRPSGRGGRSLPSKELGALRHSFLHGPVASYKEPKSLFDITERGRYWEAFGKHGGEPCESWTDSEILEMALALALDERVKTFAKELKQDVEPPDHARYLHRSARYIVALVFEGLRGTKGLETETISQAISDKKSFAALIDVPLEAAIKLLATEMRDRQKKEQAVQPEYNFLRDVSAWSD